MFESLTKLGQKAGLLTVDPVVAKEVVVDPNPVAVFSSNSAAINEDLYSAISGAIATGVDNSLSRLHAMSETMRTAIPDEAMRMKAAAAAVCVTNIQVISCIDQMLANIKVEEKRFIDIDVKVVKDQFDEISIKIDDSKKTIEDLTLSIETEVKNRDSLLEALSLKGQDISNMTAVFNLTRSKIEQDLDLEKRRINVYIPVVA